MRIVIDLQGAQSTGGRFRGIGRYSLMLATHIAKNRGEHEVIIALNGLFPETIDPIKSSFSNFLPSQNIKIWNTPSHLAQSDANNNWRRSAAEYVRESFFNSLNPDVVLIPSIFEGYWDDCVASTGKLKCEHLTAIVLYDLIPLIYPEIHLADKSICSWYEEKLGYLRQAELCLSISESSRQEGLQHLKSPENRIINISAAADTNFQCVANNEKLKDRLLHRYKISRPFVMYTGGLDTRKNLDRLIRAYALLPSSLRASHHLVIVGGVSDETKRNFEALALECGLKNNDLILTGFVPDEDLIGLYQQCKTFVFPSWHEDFGLPVLEAMCCGAPVLAANTSSIPEVIENSEALFNPFDESAIANKISQVLLDESFRQKLICHGLKQSKKFSWDSTAKRAIAALELHCVKNTTKAPPAKRPKLAFFSPLPPERSGISDYSADLLPELAKYYDIEVIVAQEVVSDAWISKNLPIRTVTWFEANSATYQRIMYQFGNSPFHAHMFDLLEKYPGVVVLHDFYLGDILHYLNWHGSKKERWEHELNYSHGPRSVWALDKKNPRPTISMYPSNKSVLDNATGVIVHSEHSINLGTQWYGTQASENWTKIPLLKTPAEVTNKISTRQALGFGDNDFVVASFGFLASTKLNEELLKAWLDSPLSKDPHCYLVFVGEADDGDYCEKLRKTIAASGLKKRIKITGWASGELFKQYLIASDIAVQLRTLSRGETSAAVLDCLNYGLPTIVNAHGSMAYIPDTVVHALCDKFDMQQLTFALDLLWKNSEQREALSKAAEAFMQTHHAPAKCAEQYFEAIERFAAYPQNHKKQLIQSIAKITSSRPTEADLHAVATSIAQNLGNPAGKQLLLDVSEIVHIDYKTGIHRVVRALSSCLLTEELPRTEVRPIYYDSQSDAYRYANHFACSVLGFSSNKEEDDLVLFFDGDTYLALDLNIQLASDMQGHHERMRTMGVNVFFVVYDILLLRHPQWWAPHMAPMFEHWLKTSRDVATGFLCISQTVAQEVKDWLQHNPPKRANANLQILSFHLGADTDRSLPTVGIPETSAAVFAALKTNPSFLMVSTIEPRKGQAQALSAFESLWAKGVSANLVLVGKKGWMIDALAEKLQNHAENGKHLFWLEGVSDEYLNEVYRSCTCLIAASEGEGFGLPLIEAAQHKLPIIARDIPVFREVAGEYAYYFKGLDPTDLSTAIEKWLELYADKKHPLSDSMPWLTWEQSTQQVLQALQLIH